MNLKSIEFVLENCECVQVDAKYISQIQIGETYQTWLWQNHLPSIEPDYFTKGCRITFDESFRKEHVYKPHAEHNYKGQPDPYDRFVKGRDVTSITLRFDNDTEQQIYVPWKGFKFTNKAQHSYFDKKTELLKVLEFRKNTINFYKIWTVLYNIWNFKFLRGPFTARKFKIKQWKENDKK